MQKIDSILLYGLLCVGAVLWTVLLLYLTADLEGCRVWESLNGTLTDMRFGSVYIITLLCMIVCA